MWYLQQSILLIKQTCHLNKQIITVTIGFVVHKPMKNELSNYSSMLHKWELDPSVKKPWTAPSSSFVVIYIQL